MHQGSWLVWALGAGAAAVTTTNPFYLLPLIGVAWLVYAAHRRPGPGARSFRLFLVFGVLTIATRTGLVLLNPLVDAPITLGGTLAAATEGLRLATLLTIFGTFNAVSDPFRVLKLAPRRWHEPALAAALALSIAPRMIEAAGKVREAQRLRGIEVVRWRLLPALAVPVLETGMEGAVTLAESMDARGHGRGRRTRYRPERWTPSSLAVASAAAVGAAAFVSSAIAGTGSLTPTYFPVGWPDAAPLLVAAVVALGVPAAFPQPETR